MTYKKTVYDMQGLSNCVHYCKQSNGKSVHSHADFKEQEGGEQKLPHVTHSCDVLVTVTRKTQQIIKQFTESNLPRITSIASCHFFVYMVLAYSL